MLVARHLGSKEKSPGPAVYTQPSTDVYKPKSPEWTLKSRHSVPERPNTAPYRDIGSTVGEGPRISLSSRHKARQTDNIPGPNYIPPGLGSDAQKSTLASRHADVRDSRIDNPGPGSYSIPPKFANEATKYTLHQRTEGGGPDHCSPGPAAYSPDYHALNDHGRPMIVHLMKLQFILTSDQLFNPVVGQLVFMNHLKYDKTQPTSLPLFIFQYPCSSIL
jgi:hypothetical protein